PYYRWNTYLVASLLLLIIITNMAMIPLWGITGAALATALSLGFYNFSMYFLLLIRYKFQPFDLRYLWVLIFGILGMVLCAATPPLPYYLWDIPVRSALFALVFLSLILLTKISPDINGFVDFLFKKVLRK
ncbi:MAG: polysaccharide biosynthesis C-terminal domain-containing protein, partial [Flavobacteriales bacterium]|nr:polysaccharide biosynthesis C-terminal domain-containing protein [Flavobacteriales bacterium]